MDRRTTALLLVISLAALSGCSALLGDGTTATPTPGADETPTATTDPAASPTATEPSRRTGTPTATPSPAPAATPTPTPTPGETFDASVLQAAHVEGLRSAGSFRTSSSLVVRNESTIRYINGSYAVERDGPALNAGNFTFVTEDGTEQYRVTRYTEGGATYERRSSEGDDGSAYRKGVEPYDATDPEPVNRTVAYTLGVIARGVVDASRWSETGTGTISGADVARYDVSGEAFGAGEDYPGAAGRATLAVDETGVVRYVAYRFVVSRDGERTEYVYEAGYTDIGAADIEEPAWTDRA